MKKFVAAFLVFCTVLGCVPCVLGASEATAAYHLDFSGVNDISDLDSDVKIITTGAYDSFSINNNALLYSHVRQPDKSGITSDNVGSKDSYMFVFPKADVGTDSDGNKIYIEKINGKVTYTLKFRYKVVSSGWGTLDDNTTVSDDFFFVSIGRKNSYANSQNAIATQVRIYKSRFTFLNSSSAGSSTITGSPNSSVNKTFTANTYDTKDCVLRIEYDTAAGTQKITLDNETVVSDGKIATPSSGDMLLDSISISGLDRMGVGSYFKLISADVAVNGIDEQSVNVIKNINLDGIDLNNVTADIPLPKMAGLTWSSSDESILSSDGELKGTTAGSSSGVVLTAIYTDSNGTVFKKDFNIKISKFWYEQPSRNEDGVYDDTSIPIEKDPQNINDSAFFGVWDSAAGEWSSTPYLRYSDYPDLSDVENAAKAGDYETAKAKLLEYYRIKIGGSRVPSTGGSTSDDPKLYYELLKRNTYAVDTIVGKAMDIFKVTDTPSWTNGTNENLADSNRATKNYIIDNCVDVTTGIKSAKGSFGEFSLMIASIDKYIAPAYIYSKESDYKPVLKVTFKNGTTKEYSCVKDSEISAGENSDVNYGSNEIIMIQEYGSATATYNDQKSLPFTSNEDFDSNTHRGYFSFDIKNMAKETSAVVSAKVEFYTYAPDYGTAEHPYKELIAYWRKDYSWEENEICWNSFSDPLYFSQNDKDCWDFVTSKNTAVKGKICGYHRGTELGKLQALYSGNKANENYAYTYLRQYMSYINHVDANPKIINELDMSNDVINGTKRLYYMINSAHMTPEIFTAYLKHMYQIADYLSGTYYGKGTNNWATFATESVFLLYARYPELANHDVWRARTKAENDRLTIGSTPMTKEDGMCIELGLGYIETILATFKGPLEAISYISDFNSEDYPYSDGALDVFHDCVRTEINISSPIGGFNIGDSMDAYTDSAKSNIKSWYNLLFKDSERWDDIEVFRYFATDGNFGIAPDPTTHYEKGLRTFMRSDWSDDALAMSFSAVGAGSHGHEDQLSIAMIAYGKSLLTDQSYGAILTGDTRKYMISPVQHNVVTINDYTDEPQSTPTSASNVVHGTDGNQIGYESNYAYDFTEYGFDGFSNKSDSLHSQRSVLFLKNQKMWIVTDYNVPKDGTKENVFTQHWHMYPLDNNGTIPMVWNGTTGVLKSVYGAEEPNVILASVDYSDETFAEKPTLYSERGGQLMKNTKGMLQKTKTGSATFGTVIIPENVGENITVSTTKINLGNPDEENAFRFDVTKDGESSVYYYYHINNLESKRSSVTVGGYSADAETILVEEDSSGNVKSVFMMNGKYVKDSSSAYILKSDTETTVAVSYDDGTLNIYSSVVFDTNTLKNLTVQTYGAQTIKLNRGTVNGADIVSGTAGFDNVTGIDEYIPPKNQNYFEPTGKVVYSLVDKKYKSIDDYKKDWTLFDTLKPQNYEFSVTENGGLRIENIAENPPLIKENGALNGTTDTLALMRFDCLFEENEENGTKIFGKGFSGKYAIEMDISQKCATDRSAQTFDTISFGQMNSDSTLSNKLITMRIYEGGNITIPRGTNTEDYISGLGGFGGFNLENYKIRVEVDTIAKNFTIYLNNYKIAEATDILWDNTNGKSVDMGVTKMEATKKGSYIQFNDIKVYEIERNTADARYADVMSKLEALDINTKNLTNNLLLSNYPDVSWSTSNEAVIKNDGTITRGDELATALLTASAVSTESPVYSYRKEFSVSVLPKTDWSLSYSEASNGVVTVNVSNNINIYTDNALLIVAEYTPSGTFKKAQSQKVSGKIINQEFTVENDSEVKVYLWNSFLGMLPLTRSK